MNNEKIFFTPGTVWTSPDLLPTVDVNVVFEGVSHDEITTVHRWNGSKWVWEQVAVDQFSFRGNDSSLVEIFVATASPYDRFAIADAVAKTFFGLPDYLRRPINDQYDYEFAVMNGFGGYYTGIDDVSNIVLDDQSVWDMSDHLGDEEDPYLEEFVAHEVAHAAIDHLVFGDEMWNEAVANDAPFWMSEYAFENPSSEDVAETIVPLMAFIEYHLPGDLPEDANNFLVETIDALPNRYSYLAEKIFDVEDYQCLVDERGWQEAASPLSCDQTPKKYLMPVTKMSFAGTKKADVIKGGRRSDLIRGKKGSDVLRGRGGDDVLLGSLGDDSLYGARGDDYLFGAKGLDVLNGGKGADVFRISKGQDVVLDFNIKQGDQIAYRESDVVEIAGDEQGAVVIASSRASILLLGVSQEDLADLGVDLFVHV